MSTKVGVIGAGGMLQYHAAGFRQAGAEIVAVADAAPGAAAKAAEKWNIAKAYESVEAMLAGSPEIEAVSIIVPNKFHKPLTIQCLEAGKHVFSEKPPAMNAGEVQEIIAAAKKAGKQVLFNFNNRARPESQAMMTYINQGVVGKINSAQAKWIRRTGIPGFGGWFTTKELSGGGPLIDLLHMVDLAMYFMGYPEPAHVLGQTFSDFIQDKQFKGPWGIPDRVGGTTDVENAAHGFVTFKTGQVLSPPGVVGGNGEARGSLRGLPGHQGRRQSGASLRHRRTRQHRHRHLRTLRPGKRPQREPQHHHSGL